MCNQSCIEFGYRYLLAKDIQGKLIIEVGAYDVNVTLRKYIESLNPKSYIGVDLQDRPGVDDICNIYDIIEKYGIESFDVVIATEVIEHISDWRTGISNLKKILKPGGVLFLTTRSRGFGYHGYPFDYWRYKVEDMNQIFSDLQIEVIESDKLETGVMLKARKPENFKENDLSSYKLYSIVSGRRCRSVSKLDVRLFFINRFFYGLFSKILPKNLKNFLKEMILFFNNTK